MKRTAKSPGWLPLHRFLVVERSTSVWRLHSSALTHLNHCLTMIHRRLFSRPSFVPSLLCALVHLGAASISLTALAQVPEPPLPPPEDESAEANLDDTTGTESQLSPDPVDAPAAAAEPAASSNAAVAADVSVQDPWEQPVSDTPVADAASEESDYEKWFRGVAIRRQTTIDGSTGVQRVREAGSGPVGTFRINFNGSYFKKNNFLCNASTPCPQPITGAPIYGDESKRSEAIASISVTPFPFLEAYLNLYNSATSNSNGSPQVLTVVGDTSLGIKGFSPAKPDQLFYYGGDFDLLLMTGTGSVGLASSATSFAFHGLLTLDLHNRSKEEDRIPFRAHLNLGYKFDNSGNIVSGLENTPPPTGRGQPIERPERYGLGISRVDSFQIGLATEYINPWVRPFLEWTMDVPVNRQGYVCNIQEAAASGDLCLGRAAGFKTSPSRLSLGTRVFPWQAGGLTLKAAIDIGTGGTKTFMQETTPEAPLTWWLAFGYVVDTVPPAPEKVMVDAPTMQAPETRRYVLGRVLEKSAGAAVPGAIIRYDGVPMTGLVASADGEFITQDLPPGEYRFKVVAEQFREGTCSVVIPETAAPAPAEPSLPPPATGNEGSETDAAAVAPPAPEAAFADADGNILVPMDCQLEELPRIANVTGLLVDSQSGGPVPDATVTITDKLNRSLKLEVDAQGSFQFRNVPFGTARLTVSAPGYMTTVSPIVIESRDELKPHILMNARPEKLALQVGRKEIKLERPIHFVGETPEVALDSMSMLEELAVALKEKPDIGQIEIQVHTDDSGAASYSRRISQERADRIREILTQLGVKAARLGAKGYGPDQPLAPNVSDESRARNNRVQIVIQNN